MSGSTSRTQALRDFISGQRLFKVWTWTGQGSYADREQESYTNDADYADVVSSQIKSTNRHNLLLDLDMPAWLVPSGTPGHHHLYVEVPGGIEWSKYAALLAALAEAGVIEEGYAEASIKRGRSDLRLPWKPKRSVTQAVKDAAPTLGFGGSVTGRFSGPAGPQQAPPRTPAQGYRARLAEQVKTLADEHRARLAGLSPEMADRSSVPSLDEFIRNAAARKSDHDRTMSEEQQ